MAGGGTQAFDPNLELLTPLGATCRPPGLLAFSAFPFQIVRVSPAPRLPAQILPTLQWRTQLPIPFQSLP